MDKKRKIALTEISVIGMILVVSIIAGYHLFISDRTPGDGDEDTSAKLKNKSKSASLPLRDKPLSELSAIEKALEERRAAKKLEKSGNFDQAEASLDNAAKKDPDNPDIQSDMAHLRIRKGELDKAMEIFASLQKKYPDKPDYKLGYADCLIAAEKIGESFGKLPEAKKTCTEVLQHYPRFAYAQTLLGEISLLQGMPDKTLALLAATAVDADSMLKLRVAALKARAHTALGNFLAAESTLNAVAKDAVAESEIAFATAEMYFEWGAYKHSLNELEILNNEVPELLVSQKIAIKLRKIKALDALGMVFESQQLMEELRILFPDSCQVALAQANHLASEGRIKEAVAICDKLIGENKNNHHAMLMLAKISAQSGDWKEAETQYRRIIQIDPENIFALAGLAHSLTMQGEFKAAGKTCESLGPPVDNFYLFKAWTFNMESAGNFASTLKSYGIYLTDFRESGTLRKMRAGIFEAQGKLENAKTAYSETQDTDVLAGRLGLSRIEWLKSPEEGAKLDEEYISSLNNAEAAASIRHAAARYALQHGVWTAASAHLDKILADSQEDLVALKERALMNFWQGRMKYAYLNCIKSQKNEITTAYSLRLEFAPLLKSLAEDCGAPSPLYFEAQWEEIDGLYRDSTAKEPADKAIAVYSATFLKYFKEMTARFDIEKSKSPDEYFLTAKRDLTTILQIQPNNRAARMRLAEIAIIQKDYTRAISVARDALKIFPEDIQMEIIIPRALYGADKTEDAIDAFEGIISRYPNEPLPLLAFGQILLEQNNLAEAKITFEKLQKLEPENTDALFGIIEAERRLAARTGEGDTKNTLQLCEKLLLLTNNLPALNARAIIVNAAILQDDSKYAEAAGLLKQLLKDNSDFISFDSYADIQTALADSLAMLASSAPEMKNEKAEALEIYTQLINTRPALYPELIQKKKELEK